LQETGFALAELAELAAAQTKLVELDAQIRQATATKRLLEHALACDCAHPGQCELVQAAGARRAAQQPIRQPSRVAS
jgi:sugar/nucleoside kinase (ribokinase family)